MTGPRLDPPHADVLAQAEAMALAGFEALASEPQIAAFAGFKDWLAAADAALPLRRVVRGFDLEPPEAALLGLLFALELSEPVARQALALAGAGRGLPAWLAQRLIPDLRADTLAVSGALRRFGLIGVEEGAGRIEARLWLAEAVLDRFCGAPACEPDTAARIAPWAPNPALASEALAARLRGALAERGPDGLSPVVMAGRLEPAMLAASLAQAGLRPWRLHAQDVPEAPARDRLARLWSRDAALDGAVLIILADERAPPGLADFIDRVAGHVVVAGTLPGAEFRRPLRVLAEAPATAASAADRWRRALGPARADRVGDGLRPVAAHFRLAPSEIDTVCARIAEAIDRAAEAGEAARILWRAAGRAPLTAPIAGVSLVEPVYRWDDIVLAPHIREDLRRVEVHVRQSVRVMDDWEFGRRMGGRGRGVVALFAGPSGTGKTMAAEVLASSLDLQMMVIDLSQIISKYVGETSKNIAAAFDQAERTGAVMVWNEGDAIWGARGSVSSATDRHVNAEIGDLLQRIETFRGFSIVTTNLREAIDEAFLRRFRFTIEFPMPSEAERLELWRQAFPDKAPVESIDWRLLAPLVLSGGNIRNIALGSAFLAAERGGPIDRNLIASELAAELRKLKQPAPRIDWGGEG